MSNDIAEKEDAPLMEQREPQTGGDIMALLKSALDQGHSIEVVRELLTMQREVQTDQAKQAYASAMHSVQGQIRPVTKAGYNEHTKKHYALLEDVHRMLAPILAEHGFSLSCGTGESPVQNHLRYILDVMHAAGHTKQYHMDLPADVAGSQGRANKNPIQAIGSSSTYARRYLECLVFGVVTANQDDDGRGQSGDTITPEQVATVEDYLSQMPDSRDAFLAWLRVAKVESIPTDSYQMAIANLKRKIRERE